MEPEQQKALAEEVYKLHIALCHPNFGSFYRASLGLATDEDTDRLRDLVRRVKGQS